MIGNQFTLERDGFDEWVSAVMAAPKGTLAYDVRESWAEMACVINQDRIIGEEVAILE